MSGDRIAAVNRLRADWRKDEAFAAAIRQALDNVGFDGRYVSRFKPAGGKRKYLKDSIWGMVAFDQTAMAPIDSPLLQRLRGIRQLGFSNLV